MRIAPFSIAAALMALPLAVAPASAAPAQALEVKVEAPASFNFGSEMQQDNSRRDRRWSNRGHGRYGHHDNRRHRNVRVYRAPRVVYVQPTYYRSYRQRPVYYAPPAYAYYQPRRMYRNDYAWRGNDGRYYCRRSDGTTGLIVGAAVGGMIGRSLDDGRDRTLGTIIGMGAGALLGRSVDRGDLRCN